MKSRPHIVIFNPDHYRGDVLGHAGNPGAVTPNLDRLVREEAVSFTRAYCQNPVCVPSRCSFMSGWYPHVRGHRTMAHMMRPDEPVLLRTLKDAGYWVWWGGKNHLVSERYGFEDYCCVKHVPRNPPLARSSRKPESAWRGEPGDDTYYAFLRGRTDLLPGETHFPDHDWAHVSGAVDLIREAPEGRPLCIYLPLLFPHLPYGVEDPWFSQIDRAKVPPRIPTPQDWSRLPPILKSLHECYGMTGWSEERWRELRAVYYGMCARIDHQAGMVVDALKARGFWDNTLFLFFSDHGDYLGDHGVIDINQNTFHEGLVRVPFVVKPPAGTLRKPGLCDALVELVDMPATVEEFTGLSLSHDHFGRSLGPLLRGESTAHRDAVFCEGGRLPGELHCMELEVAGALHPEGQYWPRLRLMRANDNGFLKGVMCRTRDFKYVRRLGGIDELYDLRTDPGERVNRIDDPQLAGALAALKDRVLTFFLETGDAVPRTIDPH
jgi:arylsulfatase A-like enzyme